MLKCILYPGAKLFVTSGGKEQSAGIVKEKVEELCALVPALSREVDWRPGKTRVGKDYVIYRFKNGSWFDNVPASERSRGKRRQGGSMEECVGIDGNVLSQVIIPMMNVSRKAADGTKHDEEPLNKSQTYITTAGYKSTFSYIKLIQFLVWMVVEPGKAYVMGGSWRVPVLAGLLDRNFVNDLKRDETFDEASFEREYESEWTGSVEGSFFNGEHFDRNRTLLQPEYEYSGRSSDRAYYILSVDVGRTDCDSVVSVIKVRPQDAGLPICNLVNIIVISGENLIDQATKLKRYFYKYHAKKLIVDGNGIGRGVIDALAKAQDDPETGASYPDFGIENDEKGEYKKGRSKECEFDAVYNMMANPAINTECHANVVAMLASGKIKFLIDEREARQKLLGTKKGREMAPEERNIYLRPYQLTSILKEEMMNLREKDSDRTNIKLKKFNSKIEKDKFSSLEYGLWYIKQTEGSKKKKRFNAADWKFFN